MRAKVTDVEMHCVKNYGDGGVMSASKRENARAGMDLRANRNCMNSVLDVLNSKCL